MPQRIQRRRTKGWRMPEGAISIGGAPHGTLGSVLRSTLRGDQ